MDDLMDAIIMHPFYHLFYKSYFLLLTVRTTGQFNVRVGPEYNRYKRKAPSSKPLYQSVAVDVFCTKVMHVYVISEIDVKIDRYRDRCSRSRFSCTL